VSGNGHADVLLDARCIEWETESLAEDLSLAKYRNEAVMILTLGLALIFFLVVLANPILGVSLMLVALYFPLLPLVNLGSIEFSVTAIPALGLAFSALMRSKSQPAHISLASWQKALLALLGLAFFLSSVFSNNYNATASMLPNLLTYMFILFGVMAVVNTPEKLQLMAKMILVLSFILSLWRVELRPLRAIFHLPSLMINGAVFNFHPAVFLALVILLFPQSRTFSSRWRWFAGLALISFVTHGIQYGTRGGWLAWLLVLPVLLNRIPIKFWVRFVPVVIIVGLISVIPHITTIRIDYEQTNTAIRAGLGQIDFNAASKDDRIRLLILNTGLLIFQEHPVLGWGANTFVILKPLFATSELANRFPGAFNSWLSLLVEMGLVGLLAGLAISLDPLWITWFVLRKQKNEITELAFGFALGVLAMTFHLFFIDLLYSFYWAHVAIALAAARLALESNPIQEHS